MSDYYHDDPIEEAPVSRFPSKFVSTAVVVFASVFFFQSTLAGNISLNSGSSIEFGQSVSVTAACAGSENLTVTPRSSFANEANGTGTYYLSSVSVSGIPSSCNGKDFNISFYDSATGSSALPIFTAPFEPSKSVATVYNNAGYFQGGFQSSGTEVSSASGAFTVTFKTPIALSTNTMKVTLQSSEHKDWAQASITGGQGHTCTLLSSSILKCWGDNGTGQLGDGTTTQRRTPVAVSGLSSAVSAISIRANHTCALLLTGAVQCWGINTNGRLGDGTTTQRTTPTNVSGLTGVIAISAGEGHTCALLRTGGVKCWGAGGKTGDNTATERLTPVDVSGLTSGVSAISAANYHTCALLSTGAVKCWGSENNGTLGNAGGGNAPGGAISGFSADVIALASGIRHTCALLSTGGVQCWGTNDEGQLGNGTTSAGSSTPVNVSGLSSGVVAISAGNTTSCALLSTGVVKCWGRNVSGQLGDNSLISSSSPVTVLNVSSAVAIGNGYYHACALLNSGAARCWGHNSSGQLGNNSTTDSRTAVSVIGIP